jgi:hypothetical protein
MTELDEKELEHLRTLIPIAARLASDQTSMREAGLRQYARFVEKGNKK